MKGWHAGTQHAVLRYSWITLFTLIFTSHLDFQTQSHVGSNPTVTLYIDLYCVNHIASNMSAVHYFLM